MKYVCNILNFIVEVDSIVKNGKNAGFQNKTKFDSLPFPSSDGVLKLHEFRFSYMLLKSFTCVLSLYISGLQFP